MKCPSCGTEVWGNIDSCPVCGFVLHPSRVNDESRRKIRDEVKNDVQEKFSFDPEPGEKIEGVYGSQGHPLYISAINSFSESLFVVLPLMLALYSGDYNLLSSYWLETILLPAVAAFTTLFLVHYFIWRSIRKRTRYIITNRRIIRFRGRRKKDLETMSLANVGMITVSRGRSIVNVTFTNTLLMNRIRGRAFKKAGIDENTKPIITRYRSVDGTRILINGGMKSSAVPSGAGQYGSVVLEASPQKKVRVRTVYSDFRSFNLGGNTGAIRFTFMARKDGVEAADLAEKLCQSLKENEGDQVIS